MNYEEFTKGANRVCLEPLRLYDAHIPMAETGDIPLNYCKDCSMATLAAGDDDGMAREAIRVVECCLLANDVPEHVEYMFSHVERFHPLATVSTMHLLINTKAASEIIVPWLFRKIVEPNAGRYVRDRKDPEYWDFRQEAITKLIEEIKRKLGPVRRAKYERSNELIRYLRAIAANAMADYQRRRNSLSMQPITEGQPFLHEKPYEDGTRGAELVETVIQDFPVTLAPLEEADLFHDLDKLGVSRRQKTYIIAHLRDPNITDRELAERLDVTDRTIRNDKRDMKRMLRPYLDKPDCIEPFHKQLHSSWPPISTLALRGHLDVAPDEEIAECPYCHRGVLRKKGKGEPYQCTRCDTPMPWKH